MVYLEIKLLEQEKLNYKIENDISVVSICDDDINKKYIKGEVRIVTEQARYPLPSIDTMINSKNSAYKLDPDYQRRRRWSNEKKSKLIESIIINVPIPPIFLYEYEFAKYEVMDGLQRLTAICEFYQNKFSLTGLEEWKELNGKTYEQLPEKIKEGIDRRYISSVILLYETGNNSDERADLLKKLVFERLNSGGVKLESQETRNALYDGVFNRLCIELSRNSKFCRMWNIPEDDTDELIECEMYRKMEDVELVLRFFALRHIDYRQDVNSWTKYFDAILRQGNNFSSPIINEYRQIFNETISLVYEIFGDNAFYLYRVRNKKWYWLERPSKAVYDPLMRVFSQMLDKRDVLILKRDEINDKLPYFYQENYNNFEGRNNNKNDIINRTNLFYKFITEIIEG